MVLIAWGARTDRRWVLPVAALLSLPVIWYGSLSLLIGVVPFLSGRWRDWNWSRAMDELRTLLPAQRRDTKRGTA